MQHLVPIVLMGFRHLSWLLQWSLPASPLGCPTRILSYSIIFFNRWFLIFLNGKQCRVTFYSSCSSFEQKTFEFHVCWWFCKDDEAQICHKSYVSSTLRVADSFSPHYCSLLVQTELTVSSVQYLQRFLKQVNVRVFSVLPENVFMAVIFLKQYENQNVRSYEPFPHTKSSCLF